MSTTRSRAWRRHHKQRMYLRARKTITSNWSYSDPNPDEKHLHVATRMQQDNMCMCSCQMCCNDRHSSWVSGYERLTMAERRAEEAFRDGVIEARQDHDYQV